MADYSLADSVNFCLFLELFLFPVLPINPEINYSRTIGSGLTRRLMPIHDAGE